MTKNISVKERLMKNNFRHSLYRAFIAVAIVLFIVVCASAGHAEVVYDLAADWSDVNNPNGVWRLYKAPGELFTTNQANYWGDGDQQAWADEPYPLYTHVPVWMKVTDTLRIGEFADVGTVIVHGAESWRTSTEFTSVTWTSPADGIARIAGGAWVMKNFRPMNWELRKNGATLSSGGLYPSDPYTKDNPFNFANGSGGAAALNVPVVQNDVLELLVYRQSTATYSTFVGIDYRIIFGDPDSDGDGVSDNEDECPDSDLSSAVLIDGCNAGLPNTLFPTGCTIADFIASCAGGARGHGGFVSCVSFLTNSMRNAGAITGRQKGAIESCAGQANIP